METIIQLYNEHEDIARFLLFLVGTFALAHIVTFLFRHILRRLTKKTTTKIDDQLLTIIRPIVYWGVILGGLYFALISLNILQSYSNIVTTVAQVCLILLLLVVSTRFTRFFFGILEERNIKKRQHGLLLTIRKVINALLYFLALIFILQSLGISISPLVASLGIGGLTVGLALQPTLSNYFSGLYMVADGFIHPGDFIELDIDSGKRGYVVEVGWRNTVIRMWDNNLVMLPNSKIADSAIINYAEPTHDSKFSVKCGVSYNSDLYEVEKIILKVAKKSQQSKIYGVKDHEPAVRFHEFGDSNINFNVILKAKDYVDYHLMRHEFIMALKKAFDEAGIVIAFPTRTVEMAKTDF